VNAKELERFLAARGASASGVDQVVRSLRKAFNLSTSGRGLNAANLTPAEISWVVTSYAASEVAAKADLALSRLLTITGPSTARLSPNFVMAFQQLITEDFEIAAEVRLDRIWPYALIKYSDGHEEIFGRGPVGSFPPPDTVIRSEGIIPGGLIAALKAALA
jgi:hypothetical protein